MTTDIPISDLVAGQGSAPGLVILGAPRCGTTAVTKWLHDAGIAAGVKDSFYLMDADAGLRGPTHVSTHGVPGYLDLFPQGRGVTVECAAGYLYQRTALKFFSAWREAPQFAVIVRDPVTRLRSVHRYFSGNLGVLSRDLSFAAYVEALFDGAMELPDRTVSDALDQGAYAKHLAPWVRRFGEDRVHVITFAAVESDPEIVLRHLLNLAGATASTDLASYAFHSYNASHAPHSRAIRAAVDWARRRLPSGRLKSWGGETIRRMQAHGDTRSSAGEPMHDATTARLSDFYGKHNAALTRIHGVDTAEWT